MSASVRVGLIGVGRWGKNYIKTLLTVRERCRLTHLCTSRSENATLVPYPVTVLSDWRQLIRSDCDAVIIASPSPTHAPIVEACVAANKPCLVEKPLCMDLATAERLSERIRLSKALVLVEYTQLFNPAYQTLKQRLGQVGEPIRLILSEGMALGPFRNEEPALWDWCPHDVGMCLDLLGRVPERVAALAGPRDLHGVPEQVSVRLDFSAGITAWIHAGYLCPSKRRLLSVFTDTRLYIFDDLASDRLTVSSIDFAQRYEAFGTVPLERIPIPLASTVPPLTAAVTYFLDALAGGDRCLCDMSMTVELTRILAQCERMMQEGG